MSEEPRKLQAGDEWYDYTGKKYVVSKVGKKYFECENFRGKFTIETLREVTQCGSPIQLGYKKEVFERLERKEIESLMYYKTSSYVNSVFTIQQLRAIRNIIEEKPSLEEYLRIKLNEQESAPILDYGVATDTIRMWIDLYNDTYLQPKN